MRHRRKTKNPASRSPNAMWRAIQTRDRGADGQFVYAVHSTGIYCRPSCPSRKPRREQVSFFLLPTAAEKRGFRACLRCQPQAGRIHDPKVETVAKVCRRIDEHISESAGGPNSGLTLAALAAKSGMGTHTRTGISQCYRNHSESICGCAANAALEIQAQERRQRDYRTIRRRIWFEQQAV